MAGDHVHGVQFAHKVLPDKVLPVHALHSGEGRHNYLLNPVTVPHQPDPVLNGPDQRNILPGDHGVGVPVKGKGRRNGAKPFRRRHCRLQQGRVPQVHSVKEPQRNYALRLAHRKNRLSELRRSLPGERDGPSGRRSSCFLPAHPCRPYGTGPPRSAERAGLYAACPPDGKGRRLIETVYRLAGTPDEQYLFQPAGSGVW